MRVYRKDVALTIVSPGNISSNERSGRAPGTPYNKRIWIYVTEYSTLVRRIVYKTMRVKLCWVGQLELSLKMGLEASMAVQWVRNNVKWYEEQQHQQYY